MENRKYSEEFKQSIVSLYNSGKSSSEICREYGMSSSTLQEWIKKYTEERVYFEAYVFCYIRYK